MKRSGQTRSQAARGRFLLAVLAAALLLGPWLIPAYRPTAPAGVPLQAVSGVAWRHDDHTEVAHFLESLRLHDGVLCLGTSETTSLPGGNWPDFLNGVEPRFAVLAGAGRTAGVHLPVLAQHAEQLKGLRLIYYINPVYWNAEHGPINPTYWTRYVDPLLLGGVGDLPAALARPIADGRAALPLPQRLNPAGLLRRARKAWFKDLRGWVTSAPLGTPIRPWEGEPPTAPDPRTDFERGVRADFHHDTWFKPVASDPAVLEARTAELQGFLAACAGWGIEATFILGPFNAPFVRSHAPEAEAGYVRLQADLAQILSASPFPWIDARDLNDLPGAFRDHQHHSSFGAAQIAEKIRAHDAF